MADGLLYPLILAVLTGAAYIAYRHPIAYAELYRTLSRIWLLLGVFGFGVFVGGRVTSISSEDALSLLRWFIAAFCVATFLRMLGPWLKHSDDKANKGDRSV